MKERPMLFSAPMVRAILDGRKTVTRRVVKVRCHSICEGDDGKLWPWSEDAELAEDFWHPCPFGEPGDRLWVRETWQGPILECDEHYDQWRESPDIFKKPGFCVYRATDTLDAVDDDGNEIGWRPSIHMPRWASRIDLEITSVRVERLQDISREDAIAEGIERVSEAPHWAWKDYTGNGQLLSPVMSFHSLWESINGPRSWDANPWVWVIEFKKLEQA